jgi:hypothetical protein
MAIFDPTCFFRFRDRHYLGLSCSNRDWFYGQRFISVLLELDDSEAQSDKARATPLPRNYFRRAAEMQLGAGRVDRYFDVISKSGTDPTGCVVRGGPQRFAPGRYELWVQYACGGDSTPEAGFAEVFAVKGRVSLARVPLCGSGWKLVVAAVRFEVLPDDASSGLEVQIDSKGVADLRLTDIAIREIEN